MIQMGMQVLSAAAGKGCSSVYEEIMLNNPTDTRIWVPVSLRGHCTSEQSCSEWSPLSYDEPLNSSRITVLRFIEHKWSQNDLMRIKTIWIITAAIQETLDQRAGKRSYQNTEEWWWSSPIAFQRRVESMDWSMFRPNTFTLVSHLSLLPLISYPRDFSSFGLFPPVKTNWRALTLSEI